jgi:hypothetical protein
MEHELTYRKVRWSRCPQCRFWWQLKDGNLFNPEEPPPLKAKPKGISTDEWLRLRNVPIGALWDLGDDTFFAKNLTHEDVADFDLDAALAEIRKQDKGE